MLGEKGEFRLGGEVAKRLYAHQLIGVRWLWSLHMMKRGGILGDDMGLGKTLQCSAFLAGMLSSGLLRSVSSGNCGIFPAACCKQIQPMRNLISCLLNIAGEH